MIVRMLRLADHALPPGSAAIAFAYAFAEMQSFVPHDLRPGPTVLPARRRQR